MTIGEFQQLIRDIYYEKDKGRGLDATFLWFVEEVGELSRALKRGTPQQQAEEFADVLAWLTTMASIQGVDLEACAKAKYQDGCPKCGGTPCTCQAGDRSCLETSTPRQSGPAASPAGSSDSL